MEDLHLTLLEKVVTVEASSKAAHIRVDKIENGISVSLQQINSELKEVVAWMNRGKGWASASILLAGFLGGLVATVISVILKTKS